MKKILVIAGTMLFGFISANAAGTLAGTTVTNNASLSYSVGGVAQTAVNTLTPDEFIVDKKIDFILSNDDSNDQVPTTPGATDAITTWTLSNTTNKIQRFTLASLNLTGGETIYGDADTADTETQTIETSTDSGTAWIPYAPFDLTDDVTDPANSTIMIRIKSDIDVLRVNGEVMNIQLEATAVQAGGTTPEVVTGTGADGTLSADRQGTEDVVLAEGAGITATGNGEFDGRYSAWGGYIIESPVLSLIKSSCVYEDLVSGISENAKRIPGATITYMLDISNTSTTTAASDINITDALPAELDITTVTAVLENDNQASCACAGGVAGIGDAATFTTATPGAQDVKIIGLTAAINSHNCVTFRVDIK